MGMNSKTIFNRIVDRLVDDDFRRAFSLILLSALLSIVSLIAFVAHITQTLIFNSLTEASTKLGIHISLISRTLSGDRTNTHGWRFVRA